MIALVYPARSRGRLRPPSVEGVVAVAYDPTCGFVDSPPSVTTWVWAFKRHESRRYVSRFPGIRHLLPAGNHLLVGKRHLTPLRVRSWRAYLRRYLESHLQ